MRSLAKDPEVIRVGNASGFYGDRMAAFREMLEGGPLDVLTGDYLAELTMLILGRDLMKDSTTGYAKTFLRQMGDCLTTAMDQQVQIVVNAGGLNPAGLAARLRDLATEMGVAARVAHVEGDDLTSRAEELGLGQPLTANAYLGAWGIVECLNDGADVVVTGRVTDASLIVAPAAAHFGWERTDYDQLAGAVVAGHVIECGTQATGGNYSFFEEIPNLTHPGFPIAEIRRDGSSVITKHDGSGGAVSRGTVTAQLMYEISGARYAGPDVTTRVDTIDLTEDGPDRVLISGVQGEAPPPQLKVSLNSLGGHRNEMAFVLTGLDIEAKAALARSQLEAALSTRPAEVSWDLARLDRPDAETEQQASAILTCVVRDQNPATVGRSFSSAAVELALASYPGFTLTTMPGNGSPYGVFTAGYVDAREVPHVAVLTDGARVEIEPATDTLELAEVPEPELSDLFRPGGSSERNGQVRVDVDSTGPVEWGGFHRAPLGTIAGARSGDKGGNANVGVWVRNAAEWRWLVDALTVEELKLMLPEAADLTVTRHVFPRLRAVNFVIEGILGQGVAYNARFDPQAKGLGEWLRSRHIAIPDVLRRKAGRTGSPAPIPEDKT